MTTCGRCEVKLLPTPNATLANYEEDPESWRARQVELKAKGINGNGAGLPLGIAVHEMRRVIGEVRPRYVLIENVAAILGMAASPGEPAGSLWGTVLGDLAALGFGCRWDCIPAAAVGAPHLRDRVFLVGERSGLWPM